MTRAVIFDIGNVLMTYDFDDYLNKIFVDCSTVAEIKNILIKCRFWEKMDLGILSEDEIIAMLQCSSPSYANEIATMYQNLGYSLKKSDYAIPWILELKQIGFQVLYLSNYSHYTISKNPNIFGFLDYMDGGILSSEVHLLKQNKQIYEALFQKYTLSPSESIFIDDSIDNIKIAHQFGMNTVLFQNYAQAHQEVLKKICKLGYLSF